MPQFIAPKFEAIYRRCNRGEAAKIFENKALFNDNNHCLEIHGINHRADPSKWVTTRRKYALLYSPKGCDPEDYRYCVIMKAKLGTRHALEMYRDEREIRRGPRGGFGIGTDLLNWFNSRIMDVDIYDLRTQQLPFYEHDPALEMVDTRKGDMAVFMAFSPPVLDIIDGKFAFSDRLKAERMSWIKTSLMWMLWRSDWGHKEGQERVVQVTVECDYMGHLIDDAVRSKDNEKASLIYQDDPNRYIIEKRWVEGKPYFARAGTTRHFGIRREESRRFFEEIAPGNIRDITPIVQEFEKMKKPNVTEELYRALELEPYMY